MADGISLIIIKGEQGYDVTQLVETIKWKGRKGSSARTLTATLIDDDGYKHARSGLTLRKAISAYLITTAKNCSGALL